MKKIALLLSSLLLIVSFNIHASAQGPTDKGYGGLDYTYSQPEMFFTDNYTLKLSAIWEILNCFYWNNGDPVDQCRNLEFYVVNETDHGDQAFVTDLEGTNCLTGCEAIVKLPLLALLTPLEYEKYKLGLVVMKKIRLHLAWGGEEDQHGRIQGRKLADNYYYLKFVLNGTGFGSIAIVRLKRFNGVVK